MPVPAGSEGARTAVAGAGVDVAGGLVGSGCGVDVGSGCDVEIGVAAWGCDVGSLSESPPQAKAKARTTAQVKASRFIDDLMIPMTPANARTEARAKRRAKEYLSRTDLQHERSPI
jgi:hypothetical protein